MIRNFSLLCNLESFLEITFIWGEGWREWKTKENNCYELLGLGQSRE